MYSTYLKQVHTMYIESKQTLFNPTQFLIVYGIISSKIAKMASHLKGVKKRTMTDEMRKA